MSITKQPFSYTILKETEKAVYASVPYYEETSEHIKKHKQLTFECWIPKVVLENGTAKHFVMSKRNEKRLQNSFQKMCDMPKSYNTFGEYAPVKKVQTIEVIDYDKLTEMIKVYEVKYGASLRTIINDEIATDEDYNIIKELEFPSIDKKYIPKKQITIYK